jgi:hypothetical protein
MPSTQLNRYAVDAAPKGPSDGGEARHGISSLAVFGTITLGQHHPNILGFANVTARLYNVRSRYASEQPRNQQPSKGLHAPKHFRAFVINTHKAILRPDRRVTPV